MSIEDMISAEMLFTYDMFCHVWKSSFINYFLQIIIYNNF